MPSASHNPVLKVTPAKHLDHLSRPLCFLLQMVRSKQNHLLNLLALEDNQKTKVNNKTVQGEENTCGSNSPACPTAENLSWFAS